MAQHRKQSSLLTKIRTRQGAAIAALATVAILATGGTVWHAVSASPAQSPANGISQYSATDSNQVNAFKAASRGEFRETLDEGRGGADADTSYIKVVINGQSKVVLGVNFTDVKSVLDQGGITLEPEDTVSPSLTTKVTESTVITIERAGTTVETSESEIPFNTIEEQTDTLPEGTRKVKTEGKNGVMESTNLVTKTGNNVVSSVPFSAYVKQAPVEKVILVGTGKKVSSNSAGSASVNLGTTAPVSQIQQAAHDAVIARGWSESDFTALVQLWNHESGWNPNALNPSSGARGIPQCNPSGGQSCPALGDWQGQITWGLNYIAGRYGSPSHAYSVWLSQRWY